MNILGIQFTLQTHSLEIYVSGCMASPHCRGCHNPESWDFSQGIKYDEDYFNNKIKSKADEFNNLIKNIMIFGGEPLDQDRLEFLNMLHDLKTLNIPIWIFTRYDIQDVPIDIVELCDYIKCGKYIEELKSPVAQYGITLATTNQHIYKKEDVIKNIS